jgi:hypothetical protein
LTRSELKDLPHIKPEKGPTSLRSAWHRRHLITGGAVLEYGPTEILSPVSPMLPRPVCLCRPRRSSRLGRRGKPWLLDLERRIPARDRFAPDSPLEGDGFEPSVPRQKDNPFRDSSFPTCARHRRLRKRSPARPAAASSSCRSRSDERRTHSPTRRSSGPPHRHHHPFAFNHRVVLLPCPLHLLLLRCRAF